MVLAKEKRHKQGKEHDSWVSAEHIHGTQDGKVRGPGGSTSIAETPSIYVVLKQAFSTKAWDAGGLDLSVGFILISDHLWLRR